MIETYVNVEESVYVLHMHFLSFKVLTHEKRGGLKVYHSIGLTEIFKQIGAGPIL